MTENAQTLIDAVVAFRANPSPETAGAVPILTRSVAEGILPHEWLEPLGRASHDAISLLELGYVYCPLEEGDEVVWTWPMRPEMMKRLGRVEAAAGSRICVRWYSDETTLLIDRDELDGTVEQWMVSRSWSRSSHLGLMQLIYGAMDGERDSAVVLLSPIRGVAVNAWPERIYRPNAMLCWTTREGVLEACRNLVRAPASSTPTDPS